MPPIPFLEMQRKGRERDDGTVIVGSFFPSGLVIECLFFLERSLSPLIYHFILLLTLLGSRVRFLEDV